MKFKFFTPLQLLKASYYNALLVVIKILSGVVTSKIVAIYLGPTGLALLGNLKSFFETISSFTASGYQNGIIRYIAENEKNKLQIRRISATVFQLSLVFSIFIGVILWIFSNCFSFYLFKTEDYSYVIKVVGLGLPLWSFNLLIIYILNGLEHYKKYVFVNSVLNIINMIVSIIFIICYGLAGGLIAAIVGSVLVFFINLLVLKSYKNLLANLFKIRLFSYIVIKNMGAYFFMSIYSLVIVSITVLFIRNLIIDKLSIIEAGYWEAMVRISNFYLMFFVSLTSLYLLPKLSKTSDLNVFKKELQGFYTLSIPLLIIGLCSIYFARFLILELLLNKEFLPTSNLFFWQLIGDFISVIAIALVKQFHAKLMIKAYIICNGLLNLMYFTFSYFFIDRYGLVGITKAYALSYLFYLPIVIVFILNYFKKPKQQHE